MRYLRETSCEKKMESEWGKDMPKIMENVSGRIWARVQSPCEGVEGLGGMGVSELVYFKWL